MGRPVFLDTLFSIVSGLGTSRDKTTSLQYGFTPLDQSQLDAAFRQDWVARKIVTVPPFDSTREWRTWSGAEAQVEAIEGEERRLDLRRKVRDAMIKARLYGGAAIVIGTGDVDPRLPLTQVKRGGLSYLVVVSRNEIQAGQVNRDVLSPYYGLPDGYSVNSQKFGTASLHPSRVVRFIGAQLPDAARLSDGWGDSILQSVNDAVMNVALTTQGVAAMVQEAKVDVIRIPSLTSRLSTQEASDLLVRRFQLANTAKGIIGALLLDKEEEWDRKEINFTALPDVLRLYLQIASGAADIPATRLLGQAPVGMNATGDSDTRNYYDHVSALQETDLTPTLMPLDELLVMSALGVRPPEVYYDWDPLWQLDELQRADVNLKNAQAHQVDAASGLVPPEALRVGRQNQLIEAGVYPGLEQALSEPDDLDEGDLPPPIEGELPGAETPQETALNGAQITALQEIVLAVGARELAPEAAVQLITVGFPTVGEERARKIVEPMVAFESAPRPAAVTPRPVADAAPRTLYVRRDLVNVDELRAWAREQGLGTIVPDPHVIVAFSRQAVDWMRVGQPWSQDEDGTMVVPPGGARLVERLGSSAVVLLFSSSVLSWRHEEIKRSSGATWDHPEYQPHVTVTYDPGDADLAVVEPFRGELRLGPEIFEEVDEDFRQKLVEVPTT